MQDSKKVFKFFIQELATRKSILTEFKTVKPILINYTLTYNDKSYGRIRGLLSPNYLTNGELTFLTSSKTSNFYIYDDTNEIWDDDSAFKDSSDSEDNNDEKLLEKIQLLTLWSKNSIPEKITQSGFIAVIDLVHDLGEMWKIDAFNCLLK